MSDRDTYHAPGQYSDCSPLKCGHPSTRQPTPSLSADTTRESPATPRTATITDYSPTDPVGRLTFLHALVAYTDTQRAIGRAEAAAPAAAGLDDALTLLRAIHEPCSVTGCLDCMEILRLARLLQGKPDDE